MTTNSLSKIRYLTGRHLSNLSLSFTVAVVYFVKPNKVLSLFCFFVCCYRFQCSLDKTNPHKHKLSFLSSNQFFGLFSDFTVMYVPPKHYLITESARILNCDLYSYRLRKEISCGSPNFSRFSLLLSVLYLPQKL